MVMNGPNLRAACAAIALVILAGCGGGGGSEGQATAKPPSSTTPTPAAVTSGPRPDDVRSDAGAIAFSKFAVERIVGVTSGAKVDDVLGLASADCKGCIKLAKDMKKAGTVKQQFAAAPVISDAKVIDTSGDQYLVEQVLELAPGRKVDTATGKTVETFKDKTRLDVRILMTWTDDRWILSNYSSEQAS